MGIEAYLFTQNSINAVHGGVKVPYGFNIIEVVTQLPEKSVEALCRGLLLAWNVCKCELSLLGGL